MPLETPSTVATPSFLSGEATVREKSMMYRTELRQNMHGVSITAVLTSVETFMGNERRQSVHVSTIYGTPRASFPFLGTHTGADCLVWALVNEAELRSTSRTSSCSAFNSALGALA